jgi:hypothetical protein
VKIAKVVMRLATLEPVRDKVKDREFVIARHTECSPQVFTGLEKSAACESHMLAVFSERRDRQTGRKFKPSSFGGSSHTLDTQDIAAH